ncbi:TusE/DsrC/DsvC family sulfur relay protein [Catenovulum sp. SM1970]|uniref:TusE/DsrC/DsvC family sulfur relay protein n=1 Tax=Marinifaba aquimaris TaxID=2741323 RepID=UPI00157465E7|nr:TusE/DsrC/DsvC family sulfur relay protein [Marinifaba aquimaris]NTS75243.1 TusE/DsrC/DsvC family sulfur relay protein [Marinifaba aquimaris]
MTAENTLNFEGKTVPLDKHGYLTNYMDWQPDMAPLLAESENIVLSEAHWEVINFVRNFYLEFKTSPAIRVLVKAIAKQLGEDKGNSPYLYKLFPKGPAKQATKIAGLPKPAKCI